MYPLSSTKFNMSSKSLHKTKPSQQRTQQHKQHVHKHSKHIPSLQSTPRSDPTYIDDISNNITNISATESQNEQHVPLTQRAQNIIQKIGEFEYHITDTFIKYDTRSLLCGKTFTPYHKSILLEVIRYYAHKEYTGMTNTEQLIIEYVQKIFDADENVTYDDLMSIFNARSNECMLAYILIGYNNDNLDLILRCMYTFCRVLPFHQSTEWYDNYRLNNYGNPLNMIMWKDYDCSDTYTINEAYPHDINKSVEINYKKVAKRLVGSLRAFIIDHDLFPNKVKDVAKINGGDVNSAMNGNNNVNNKMNNNAHDATNNANNNANKHKRLSLKQLYTQTYDHQYLNQLYHDFVDKKFKKRKNKLSLTGGDIEDELTDIHTAYRLNKNDTKSKGLTAEQICDLAYEHFPYFYGGAHGCDVFDTPLSCSLEEIDLFLKRYPSAKIGYILNTSTYASGGGEHWVALELSKGQAKLICSQASSFNSFHDNGKLDSTLQALGYGQIRNEVSFQTDTYSCGIFSALSLYLLLISGGNIRKTVDMIGTNGENIAKGMDINDIREKWAGTTPNKY